MTSTNSSIRREFCSLNPNWNRIRQKQKKNGKWRFRLCSCNFSIIHESSLLHSCGWTLGVFFRLTLCNPHAFYRGKKEVERLTENAYNLEKKGWKIPSFSALGLPYAIHFFDCLFLSLALFRHDSVIYLFFFSFPLIPCILIKKVLARMNPNTNKKKLTKNCPEMSWYNYFICKRFRFAIFLFCQFPYPLHLWRPFVVVSYLLRSFTFEHVFTSSHFFLCFLHLSDQFSIKCNANNNQSKHEEHKSIGWKKTEQKKNRN